MTDLEILKSLKDKKIILVLNKSDLIKNSDNRFFKEVDPEYDFVNTLPQVVISSLTGSGMEELKNLIQNMFYKGSINIEEDVIITNERHKELLIKAGKSIEAVLIGIDEGMSEDFLTIDLMDAYEALGGIIGESVEDDLADRIFSDFCMGK